MRRIAILVCVFSGLAAIARGGLVLTLADMGANDSVDWGQAGVAGTAPPNPFMLTSASGAVTITVTNLVNGSDPNAFSKLTDPAGWGLPGTALALNNQFNGPTTIDFSSPVQGVGLYISYAFGAATFESAVIEAFNGNTDLGEYGFEPASGSEIVFAGILDATADITSIEIETVGTGQISGPNYFALDTLELVDTPPDTGMDAPEPGTLGLVFSAMGAMLLRRRANRPRGRYAER